MTRRKPKPKGKEMWVICDDDGGYISIVANTEERAWQMFCLSCDIEEYEIQGYYAQRVRITPITEKKGGKK